jgi:hypothetical protein
MRPFFIAVISERGTSPAIRAISTQDRASFIYGHKGTKKAGRKKSRPALKRFHLSIKHGENILLALNADYCFGGFPVLENNQSRDAHHIKPRSEIRLFINIDFAHVIPSIRFIPNFIYNRGHHAARSTPGRPKIYKHRPVGFQNRRVKIISRYCYNCHIDSPLLL